MYDQAPFSAVKDFIREQRQKGKLKGATARALETACSVVLGLLEPGQDSLAYVEAHLAELFVRYRNLNPKLGNRTIAEYQGRIGRAIAAYRAHRFGDKPRAARRPAEPSALGREPVGERARVLEPAHTLTHRLPLQSGLDAEITLPRELSQADADRVAAWIGALVKVLARAEASK